MLQLFLLVAIAFLIWHFYSKRNTLKTLRVRELRHAVNDAYGYLKEPVIRDEAILKEALSGRKTNAQVIEGVLDAFGERVRDSEGWIVLGERPPNLSRGIELENEYGLLQESLETPEDLSDFKKLKPKAEAQLSVWRDVTKWSFPVVLTQDLRDRHTYIIGKSGSGKSTLLTWMIFQDIFKNEGCALLTPEAETIEDELLPFIPPSRLDDIIYVNPADEQNRHSFNPLHLDPADDLDLKVEEVLVSLSRLMEGETSPRINQILRQLLYALIEFPNTTLLDIPRLLDRENPHFRKNVVAGIADERAREFWRTTYEELPQNAHVPIISRLAPFVRPRRIRNALCRPEQGLNFREVMDSGRILLCNLSDGLLGEKTSQILGGFIMSEIQLATVGRANVPQHKRPRFYVYLDEFQSFVSHANVSYEKLLSRARKYHLPLTLAHQQTGQLSPQLVREIFGNVSTIVSFLVSREDANRISREFVRDDRPESTTVDPTELVTLNVGDAFVKIGTHAFPLSVSLKLEASDADYDQKRFVIEKSRRSDAIVEERQTPRHGAEGSSVDPFADDFDPQELF